MLETIPRSANVPETIRRRGGGGPRRIAESAGIVITHGEGAHLVGDDGRRYLDFATAMGVAAIGHGHPTWVRAVSEQAARAAACILHTPQHAAYLDALTAFVPADANRIALYSGGAEAVEVAVRLAQSASGRPHVLSFTDGFHGKTAGVRFAGNRFPDERQTLEMGWIHHADYPVCTDHDVLSYSTCEDTGRSALDDLEVIADGLGDRVGAVIVEPLLGTAGNVPPERLFLRALRELCDRRGWLLIADESITGFGRLGHAFACDAAGIAPDILVLGKAIGGGFPLSAVAAPSRLWDTSLYAELSATSSSYGANPLACAAGLAVLDIVTAPGFLDNVAAVGQQLAAGLAAITASSDIAARPRGFGMMLGFDLLDPSTGDLAGTDLCRHVFRRCLEAGILIVGDVPRVRLNPPLILTRSEADEALSALERGLCR